MKFKIKLIGLFGLFIVTSACNPKKIQQSDEFKRGDLLSNISTVIQEDYQNVFQEFSILETKYNEFLISFTEEDFDSLKSQWQKSYISWQNVLAYDFGPGMENNLKTNLGIFPTDTLKVLKYIEENTYDLTAISSNTAKGIHVFDYLLYRNNAIVYFKEKNYAAYGKNVLDQMKTLVQNTISSWKTYQTTFITSTSNEATSAFSKLVNSYIKAYENCKWSKIGTPLGKQSLEIIQPKYIETPKAKITWKLFNANVTALKRIFNGNTQSGKQGVGFDDYMAAVNKTDLVTKINADFDDIIATSQGFKEDLGTMILDETKKKQVNDLYTKIQNLTIHLKTDMSAAFAVMITYSDNDGD